jgi:hypothetical protein
MQQSRRPHWNVMSPFSLVTDTSGTSQVSPTKRTDDYHSKWHQARTVSFLDTEKTIYVPELTLLITPSDSAHQNPQ